MFPLQTPHKSFLPNVVSLGSLEESYADFVQSYGSSVQS
jgi:hypothetical protein